MNIQQKMLSELRSVVGRKNVRVTFSEGVRNFCCEVKQCDPLAVSISCLILQTDELSGADVGILKSASQALCNRVTYLLEPISPIETDADGCIVQMRSNPPHKDDNGYRYYELLLRRGGNVTLYRFEKKPGVPRESINATLTHEVVGRLADDFNTAVDEVLAQSASTP